MKGLGTREEAPASPGGTQRPSSHGWGAGQPEGGLESLGARDKDQEGTHLGAQQGRGCVGSARTSPPGQHPAPWLAMGHALRILLAWPTQGLAGGGPSGHAVSFQIPSAGARAGRRRGSREPLALVLLQIGCCSRQPAPYQVCRERSRAAARFEPRGLSGGSSSPGGPPGAAFGI